MSPEARERSFDELARGLASGSISRGKALRLMGAALVGGLLASMPGVAQAEPSHCDCAEGDQCCKKRDGGGCCGAGESCCGGGCCLSAQGAVCCRLYDQRLGVKVKTCLLEAQCLAEGGRVVKE
jgi:hypothetical protein